MKILVLGGTGFIGRNMVNRFVDLGHHVTATHHLRPVYEGPHWVRADLREPFDFSGYDIVIQAAATTSGAKDIINTPAIHVTDNVVMNALIFRAAVEAGVKHVIFFSCTTMFSSGVITEESPIDVHPKYFGVAHTKLYNEKMCEFYAGISDTKFIVIRHSNVFGPFDKFDLEKSHVMGATIAKVMQAVELRPGGITYIPHEMTPSEITQYVKEKRTVKIWGTGEEERDLLYVDDLVDFVELAIARQPEKFGVYNCGSGVAIAVKDLVQKVIYASGKPLLIEHDLTKPSIPISLSLDCSKAKRELGWEPKVSPEEGIKRTITWYKENVV